MKPGRELDALVAEKVMGWEDNRGKYEGNREPAMYGIMDYIDKVPVYAANYPCYSEDITASWEVVEKLIRDGKHVDIVFYQALEPNADGPPYEAHWSVTGMYGWSQPKAVAETAPHAICLAALKAVGYKV